MATYKLTGKTLKGNYFGNSLQSCKLQDAPTGKRIVVNVAGVDYERALYERYIWSNSCKHTHVDYFVIINDVRYQMCELPTYEEMRVLYA